MTCSATLQRVTQLSSPATAANTKATQSISALASRVGCGSFAQLKPPRHFGAERRDSPASPIGAARRFHSDRTQEDGGIEYGELPVRTNCTEPKPYSCFDNAVALVATP
jgi:transcription initiation factor TFIID subunit TAF12